MKRKQENPLAAPKRRGQFASICLRYKKNKMAMFGLVVFLIVVFFAVSLVLIGTGQISVI